MARQRRKKGGKAKRKIDGRLASYASTAGAALASGRKGRMLAACSAAAAGGSLALVPAVDAAIKTYQCSAVQPGACDFAGTATDVSVNMDQSGASEFKFYATSFLGSRALVNRIGAGGTSILATPFRYYSARRYAKSAATMSAAKTSWYPVAHLQGSVFGSTVGNFNGQTGYFGVRFQIGANTHYGWIKYQGTGDLAGTVLSWAYEDTPNTGIVVGSDGPTSVELASYDASVTPEGVELAWETSSEQDTAGFNILRGEVPEGPYAKINDALIPAEGGPAQGASYSFLDTPEDLVPGTTYSYKLEDVDDSGASTLHGPEAATWPSAPELWSAARAEASAVDEGSAAAANGFSIFSLFLPPAATILLWQRRRRGR